MPTGAFVRRHLVSIAIGAVATLLGGYLYFVDSGRVTTAESDLRKRNLFKAFRRAAISELVIENHGDRVHITRRPDDAGDSLYYLEGGEVADQTAVDKTLSVLEFATAERRIEGAVDRQAFGLDAPKTRVTVSMGSLTWHLAIGGPAAAPPGGAYAEIEGEGVAVVSRDLVTELAQTRDAYRGRTLLPYLSSSLAELTIEGGGETRHLVRGAWGGWALASEGGKKVRVDRLAFDRLLTSLADVRAEAFIGEVEANQALAGASDRVRMTMVPLDAKEPRAEVDIGGECPGHAEDAVAIRVEPPPRRTACVPKGVVVSFSTPVESLTDRHLFTLRPDEMESIALVADGTRLEMARLGTGWHLRAPSEGKVDHDVGQDFARALSELEAEAIAPDPGGQGIGVVRATARITKVGESDDPSIEVAELGNDRADGYVLARRAMDGAVLRFTRDAARVLLPSSVALRSRKVIDEPPGHVGRITIEGRSIRQVLRRSGAGVWTLEEPKSLAVDPGLASDIADALSQLRADRWVADRDDGSFGLESPAAAYQIETEGGSIRVETGRATSGGVFARRTDRDGVFVLPAPTERTLETWAVDRSLFMALPSEVRSIRIDRGSDHLEVGLSTRDGGAAAERFELACRALSEARAEGLVHLGPARKEEGFDKPTMKVTVDRAAGRLRFVVGRGDVWRDVNVLYARRDGIDATFAIAQSKLKALLDLR